QLKTRSSNSRAVEFPCARTGGAVKGDHAAALEIVATCPACGPIGSESRRPKNSDLNSRTLPTTALQGLLKVLNEIVGLERLGQETARAGACSLGGHGRLGKSRDKDERYLVAPGAQAKQELDAVGAGHVDVSDHAGGQVEHIRLQKFVSRPERENAITKRPQQ